MEASASMYSGVYRLRAGELEGHLTFRGVRRPSLINSGLLSLKAHTGFAVPREVPWPGEVVRRYLPCRELGHPSSRRLKTYPVDTTIAITHTPFRVLILIFIDS